MHNPFVGAVAALIASIIVIPLTVLSASEDNLAARWSWQDSYAEVNPKGDLTWKSHPFVFEKGGSVRYIDFETGDDANTGETTATAWKHHPWDPNAAGKSAAGNSVDTYVFKRGVSYRGHLVVKSAGEPAQPIRLTSDPGWGSGEAVLCGSERVIHWTRGADRKDIPEPE